MKWLDRRSSRGCVRCQIFSRHTIAFDSRNHRPACSARGEGKESDASVEIDESGVQRELSHHVRHQIAQQKPVSLKERQDVATKPDRRTIGKRECVRYVGTSGQHAHDAGTLARNGQARQAAGSQHLLKPASVALQVARSSKMHDALRSVHVFCNLDLAGTSRGSPQRGLETLDEVARLGRS